ncbi:unnamed protein product [Euphydryas editha]|uniref:Uncharacterized protein n=1 Tax=Euphydryas editha TaxID=104508 RepID=A0AAU9UE37_EUPED|nr:unnamed protein product [Euphydryas editha]
MSKPNVICELYFGDSAENRNRLFSRALSHAKDGKVLYILSEELNELPELSQDVNKVDRHYLKMITFLYASNIQSLTESLVTLHTWQNIPSTVILDDLSKYCTKDNFQAACGITALFIDTVNSCSNVTKTTCRFYLGAQKDKFSKENVIMLKELYFRNVQETKET